MRPRIFLSNMQKPKFYTTLFSAIALLLLAVVVINYVWEYRFDVSTMMQRGERDADEVAERIRVSIVQLADESSIGGKTLDKYIDSLNGVSSILVRVIHSESIDAQYGPEPGENERPLNQNERDALADGIARRWTAEERFVRVLPIKAAAPCVDCHNLPGPVTAHIPVGYVLGLVEVSVPVAPTSEERRGLLEHSVWAVGSLLIFTAISIFTLYRLMIALRLEVAERKKAEDALKKTNEDLNTAMATLEKSQALLVRQEKLASIGTLSAGVAHEILNPLNIIGATVQVMQTCEWPEETKDKLNEIMTQVRRAARITDNLRIFAHVQKRGIAPVEVHALFDKTVLLLEHDLRMDNIMVERDYDKNLPPVHADHDLLAQVFLNVLSNARHALREVKDDRKKLIIFKTRASVGGVELSLSNNGPRIPEDVIDKIFDPFFTTKDPNKGTGLGLSLAHTFIRDFGGTITVRNDQPEGVTFIITLPAPGGFDKPYFLPSRI